MVEGIRIDSTLMDTCITNSWRILHPALCSCILTVVEGTFLPVCPDMDMFAGAPLQSRPLLRSLAAGWASLTPTLTSSNIFKLYVAIYACCETCTASLKNDLLLST